MINAIKKWIGNVARQSVEPQPLPPPVAHGAAVIQVYKISNGYLFYKSNTSPYREDNPSVIYCATPMDVAKRIVNGEVLEKMGIRTDPKENQVNI